MGGKGTEKDSRKRSTSDIEKSSREEHLEEIHEESREAAGNDRNTEHRHSNYEDYGRIEPALRNWDNAEDGIDNDCPSLLEQVLSVNIFPFTHSAEELG
ncbi:hypothetical protein RRF57_000954 [Xylaria bambusicola]|uniref:Uncharacterized protein n=1 Tax=Xylaria bambusicola TaxID=326684 RepID=A0AAN7Z326_9PEZI